MTAFGSRFSPLEAGNSCQLAWMQTLYPMSHLASPKTATHKITIFSVPRPHCRGRLLPKVPPAPYVEIPWFPEPHRKPGAA